MEQNSTICLAFTHKEQCWPLWDWPFLLQPFGSTQAPFSSHLAKTTKSPWELAHSTGGWFQASLPLRCFNVSTNFCRPKTMSSPWWYALLSLLCSMWLCVGALFSKLNLELEELLWVSPFPTGSTCFCWQCMLSFPLLVTRLGLDFLKMLYMIFSVLWNLLYLLQSCYGKSILLYHKG